MKSAVEQCGSFEPNTIAIPQETELVSFDLWLTLIKSGGRAFKDARNKYLGEALGVDMSPESFDALARETDKEFDKIAEARGTDVFFQERVKRLAAAAGVSEPSDKIVQDVYDFQREMLLSHPPALLDEDTPDLLSDLKRSGRQLAIISNTGYLHGDLMRPTLDAIGIGSYFDRKVFSNEVGYAKPHPRIFQELITLSGIEPVHITHIGDNPNADVLGATQVGMNAIHLVGDVTLRSIVEASIK